MKVLSHLVRLTLLAVLLAGTALSAKPVPPVHAAGTVITVNTVLDSPTPPTSGECSLREAIINANNDARTFPDCAAGSANDIIVFAEGVNVISLNADLPLINDTDGLTIDGTLPGNGRVTIHGQYRYRMFYVLGSPLRLQNLNLSGGYDVSPTVVGEGAAILNVGGTVVVTNTTFYFNEAERGGAITNDHGNLIVANSLFLENFTSGGNGGAVETLLGTSTFLNNTFTGNRAAMGGDLSSSGTVTLINNIFANSQGGGNCDPTGGSITGHHNLIEDAASACGFTNGVNSTFVGYDPAFATNDGALSNTSPAIDAGDDATCATAPINNTSYNGLARPQGAHCDIGAYENPYNPFAWGQAGDIPVPANYNGDSRADMAVFRPSNGTWYIQGQLPIQHGTLLGDIPVPADYDGDGKTDIAVFRPSTGFWYIKDIWTGAYGMNGDIPVPADYDGDSKADLAVFRPSTGVWYISGQAPIAHGTLLGDRPVPADYNGDRKVDVAVFRPSTGTWYIVGQAPSTWGTLLGDIPLPANYIGDQKAEIAVFRPSTGTWYVVGQAPSTYGTLLGDVPVPADYTNDGQADIAIFRPADGTWHIVGVTP